MTKSLLLESPSEKFDILGLIAIAVFIFVVLAVFGGLTGTFTDLVSFLGIATFYFVNKRGEIVGVKKAREEVCDHIYLQSRDDHVIPELNPNEKYLTIKVIYDSEKCSYKIA